METKVLNQEWKLTVPDGFREMDESERGGVTYLGGAPQWTVTDPERHIVVLAAWKKSGLAALMLSPKEVAKKMEAGVRGPMAAYAVEAAPVAPSNKPYVPFSTFCSMCR